MMDGGMGWMMALGWLGAILVVVLLIAAVIAAARLLLPAGPSGKDSRAAKVALIVLAVIGAVALATVLGTGLMHWGMMDRMMGG